MSSDPKEFVKAFEERFRLYRNESRINFLVHFRPRELHFYILVSIELKLRFRKQTLYFDILEKFPVIHWGETILELLGKFAKKKPMHPSILGYENGVTFIEAGLKAFPEYFADNLDQVFLAGIRFPGHVGTYIWKKFGAAYADFIRFHIEVNENDQEEQCRALCVAFLISNPELTKFAKDTIRHHLNIPRKLIEGLNLTNEMLNAYLIEQGLIWYGNDLYHLYPEEAWHIVFPSNYLKEDISHETWSLKFTATKKEFVFGGTMMAQDHSGKAKRIQHLISLDPIPKHLQIRGLHRLIIACDLNHVILNPGISYQKHAPNGAITLLDDDWTELNEASIRSLPFIRSTKVQFSNQGPAWYYQRYIKGHNHYRIGGPPVFISGTYYPECKQCNRTMRYLMELDSSLPLSSDKALEWGVEGMAYFYWCDQCSISAIHWFSD